MKLAWKKSFIFLFVAFWVVVWAVWQFYYQAKGVKFVQVEKAKQGDIQVYVSGPGQIDSLAVAEVKSKESGSVKSLLIKDGQAVKKGQLLGVIANPDLEESVRQNQIELKFAEYEYKAALEKYQQEQELYKDKVISRQQLEETRISFLKLRDQQLPRLRKEAAAARTKVANLSITAPIDGKVVDIKVKLGSEAGGGSDFCKIVDFTKLIAKIKVDELDIGQVQTGQPVEVRGDTFAPKVLPAQVYFISPEAKRDGRLTTIEVWCRLTDTGGVKLTYGASCEGKIKTGEAKNILTVPQAALIDKDGQANVFIIKKGRATLLPVKTGLKTTQNVEITDGLKAGQEVITGGNLDLKPGDKVRIGKSKTEEDFSLL